MVFANGIGGKRGELHGGTLQLRRGVLCEPQFEHTDGSPGIAQWHDHLRTRLRRSCVLPTVRRTPRRNQRGHAGGQHAREQLAMRVVVRRRQRHG